MNFVKLCQIIEALRIQQKVKDKEKDPNFNIPQQKQTFSSRVLPKIKNYKIVIEGHTKETRKGENVPRDYKFTDSDYSRILTKFISKIEKDDLDYGRYSIFYKSKSSDYDMLGINYTNNRIQVITIIQNSKPINKYRFSSELDMSDRIILESYTNKIIL